MSEALIPDSRSNVLLASHFGTIRAKQRLVIPEISGDKLLAILFEQRFENGARLTLTRTIAPTLQILFGINGYHLTVSNLVICSS